MKEYKLNEMSIKSYQNKDGSKYYISITSSAYGYKAKYEFASKEQANKWFKASFSSCKDLQVKIKIK